MGTGAGGPSGPGTSLLSTLAHNSSPAERGVGCVAWLGLKADTEPSQIVGGGVSTYLRQKGP